MAWTTPKTWSAGAGITASELNTHIRDNENWLKGAFTQLNVTSDSAKAKITPALCGARVYKAADQSITTATDTAVNLDSEFFDSDTFHDNATNNTRITIPASMGGYYMIGGNVLWASNATGQRQCYLRKNGSLGTVIATTSLPAVAATVAHQNVSTLYQFAAADYMELIVFQSSGGNLAVTATTDYSPVMWIHRFSAT